MFVTDGGIHKHRLIGLLGALGVHLVVALLFAGALRPRDELAVTDEALTAVTIVDQPLAPAIAPEPRKSETTEASGEASSPLGLAREALPQSGAPPPQIILPPLPAISEAGRGQGPIAADGNQESNTGLGGYGAGDGEGRGGIAMPAQRIAGGIRDSDYPPGAERQGLQGTVEIGFRVKTDGRVDGCKILHSSGYDELDQLTCALFTQRYRFRAAQNSEGLPVESTLRTTFTWGIRAH